ncbi:long-chain fatty acid transport protein 4-like, partial [Amphibalanus amphitrite]|uniref:long-chain fatty acid transport protein 4-like n=1 Tax=Amphibalanus amphitrite TaxID=1232801 RepID=UPI001C906BFF
MSAAGRVALYGGASAVLWFLVEITAGQILAALFAVWVLTGGWRMLRIAYRTLPRELMAVQRFGRLLYKIKVCERYNMSVPELFQQTVAQNPNKTAIMFEEQRWTYRE